MALVHRFRPMHGRVLWHAPDAGAGAYVDAATVYVDIQASSTEVFESVDSGTVYVDIDASALEEYDPGGVENVDAGEVYVDIQASAVETTQFRDAATVYVDLNASAVEARVSTDTGTVYVDISATAVEVYAIFDSLLVGNLRVSHYKGTLRTHWTTELQPRHWVTGDKPWKHLLTLYRGRGEDL